ncbi:chromate resistance transporter [Vulcanimicrobium alpinum]|uniref:Chromate resistance transporter n=1 Tax=Vulcanimicrobium alpinum TaxID=3016050 RepID=A0AAN1XXC4_UNVUL|nr:chromate resistance transporter [Vulcanimicrobium alpinum]
MATVRRARTPSVAELTRYFFVLGATGFGGPVALANIMRRDLVDERGWIDEAAFERGLAVATTCPGPMAYQLGVYCGYVTHGIGGALAAALAFAIAPFAIVVAAAALYQRFAGARVLQGLFYGIGPIVVALILRASWTLGRKTLRRDVAAWCVAVVACGVTVALQRELIVLFLAAGVLGIVAFAPRAKPVPLPPPVLPPPSSLRSLALPPLIALVPSGLAPALFWFFLKTGFLVFGSGLVIVSFVKSYVVDQYHWLDDRTFVDAVAIGLISPGPVVITATFVGYVIAGFTGALAATAGIFLPSIVLTVAATPLLLRYGGRPRVAGFVRGVTVAVVGVLAGTTYLVGRPVIVDAVSALLLVGALAAPLLVKRVPDQAYVVAGAAIGVALRH